MASKVESTRFSSLQELDDYAEESLPEELSRYEFDKLMIKWIQI